jgi:tyrosinase
MRDCVFAIWLLTLTAALAQETVTIFSVPMPPHWPVVLAAVVPKSLNIPATAQFSWRFPTASNPSCTSNGVQNVSPCTGKIVDHWFPEGDHRVELSITDSSISFPITATTTLQIRPIDAFPVASRPEIRSIPIELWNEKYVKAFYRLKENGVYDHLSAIHRQSFSVGRNHQSTQRSAAHASPAFLPWHRMSMRVLERCIQVAAGDDELGMPYMDWMLQWTGLDQYVGGTGDASQNFVLNSGPFSRANWTLPDDYAEPVKALHRNLGADASFRWQTQEEWDRLMAISNYDLPPFNERPTPGSFRNALEGWLVTQDLSYGQNHNGVHRYIAGTMGAVIFSFQDPVFHLHHTNVDRIFTIWQKRHQCDTGRGSAECYRPGETDPDVNENLPGFVRDTTTAGKARFGIQGAMYTDVLWPTDVRIDEILIAESGYRYLAPGQRPLPSGKLRYPLPGYSTPVTRGKSTSDGQRAMTYSGLLFGTILAVMTTLL